jgi:hypothetical protein
MNAVTDRRLPAFGRQIRDNLSAGMLPALGGGAVAVCIGWPMRCALAHVVCVPVERAASQWEFGFLAGVETMVWFARQDESYAQEVRDELVRVGCPLVVMLELPEIDQ